MFYLLIARQLWPMFLILTMWNCFSKYKKKGKSPIENILAHVLTSITSSKELAGSCNVIMYNLNKYKWKQNLTQCYRVSEPVRTHLGSNVRVVLYFAQSVQKSLDLNMPTTFKAYNRSPKFSGGTIRKPLLVDVLCTSPALHCSVAGRHVLKKKKMSSDSRG